MRWVQRFILERILEAARRHTEAAPANRHERHDVADATGERSTLVHHGDRRIGEQDIDLERLEPGISHEQEIGECVIGTTAVHRHEDDAIRCLVDGEIDGEFEVGAVLCCWVPEYASPIAFSLQQPSAAHRVEIAHGDVYRKAGLVRSIDPGIHANDHDTVVVGGGIEHVEVPVGHRTPSVHDHDRRCHGFGS